MTRLTYSYDYSTTHTAGLVDKVVDMLQLADRLLRVVRDTLKQLLEPCTADLRNQRHN